jgi:hypothetical protein
VGDTGVASDATTLSFGKVAVTWDTGKTLKTRTTQLSSWKIKTGTKGTAASGKTSGKDGASLTFGGTTTLRGSQEMYGAHLRCLSGNLSIFSQPGGGLTNEWVNCMLEGAGIINLGSATLGPMSYVYDVTIMSSTTGAVMANFVADYAEKVAIFCPTPTRFISTGSVVKVRDLEMVGAPTNADIGNTGVTEWDLVQVSWSQNAKPVGASVSRINIWDLIRARVVDPLTGAPRAGIYVDLYDVTGALIFSVSADALGGISVGTPGTIYENAVKLGYWSGAEVFTELGPFRMVVNGTATDSSRAVLDYKFDWPYRTFVVGGSTYKQFLPLGDIIPLGPPPVPASPPVPILAEDVPLAAPGEIRFEDAVPEPV